MKRIDVIDATQPGVIVGRHSIWIPHLQVKIPFQFGGQVTKYGHDEAGYDPGDTIPHELAILRAMSAERHAPPVGELVRIDALISNHLGAWHCDPVGAWGYEMADATTLPPGRFSVERMRTLPIAGSEGAWNDISVAGRDNVVNGYLIDVRRSAWDMLRWTGGELLLPHMPNVIHDEDELRARVHRECQFPAGERCMAYQDFWIGNRLEHGQRRVAERACAMGFYPELGDSVLDIGTQSGGFLQYAWMFGARKVAGVEVDPRYVECARALARSCGQNICIRQMDVVADRAAFLEWVRAYFPGGPKHLLALSLEKHVGEKFLFDLIDEIGAHRTYIETNAVGKDKPMKLWPEVEKRGGRHVGDSTDRNLRRLYQIGAV